VVPKVGEIASLGSILVGKGAKETKGGWGTKQHKGGKNDQPLIDH